MGIRKKICAQFVNDFGEFKFLEVELYIITFNGQKFHYRKHFQNSIN